MKHAVSPKHWRQIRISDETAAISLGVSVALVLCGWFAAFTSPGAEFIYLGTAIAMATVAVSRRLWTTLVAAGVVGIGWFLPFIVGGIFTALRTLGE